MFHLNCFTLFSSNYDHSGKVAENISKKESTRSDFLKQNAMALSHMEAYKAQVGTGFDTLNNGWIQTFNRERVKSQSLSNRT